MDYPLKKGSKNDSVKELQFRLNKFGAGLNPDGDFGDKTEIALFKYTGKKAVNSKSELDSIVPASNDSSISVDYNRLVSKIPSDIFPNLVDAMKKYSINTANRVSHFVSQCMHESANYTRFVENLNYSAEGLRKVFPKYFPDDAIAKAYAKQPEKIGSRVYADRMGNGSELTKEGYIFRGRGGIQRTGKNNYKTLSDALGVDFVKNPDLLLQPKYFTLSDAQFFSSNGLNTIADKGATDEVVKEITKKINGGYTHLSDRINKFKEIYSIII